MHGCRFWNQIYAVAVFVVILGVSHEVEAAPRIATTTITVSICGDFIVNAGEDCDTATTSSAYSTTITGRNCTASCKWAPYCGDGILQTIYNEECDDGNNDSNDFCAADCKRENAGSGGGASGGGGSSSSGGVSSPLNSTQVRVSGKAYPSATVNILIDGVAVGSVRTNSQGEFTFTTGTNPGASSLSFWAKDSFGTRSTTFNTTFDVTQGAVTDVSGILIPPTITANDTTVNPGDTIVLSGQTIPNANVEVSIDNDAIILRTVSDSSGNWSVDFDTSRVSADTHIAKARFVEIGSSLRTESIYGTTLSLAVGVEGKPTSNSDLNRDGKVDLIDFSILIFWWGTSGGSTNPPADVNQNGNVGLEDFSILLFNWTG